MFVKRLLDIVLSAVALLVCLPLGAMIATALVIDSGFPVLYVQRRVGRGFREFPLVKFRTMIPSRGGTRITVAGDKRVTRVGRFLRAYKLDELPQLWNILRGDMSLVGPRPELPEFVDLFRARYERILMLRPGLTDIASIRFRHEEELLAQSPEPMRGYVESVMPVKLDLAEEYVLNRSLQLDLSILARTLLVIVRTA